jgi:hypothetical protein
MAKFLDNNGVIYLLTKLLLLFQQKEAGKGLSANDFTDSLKSGLESLIAAGPPEGVGIEVVSTLPAEPVAGQLVYMTGTYEFPNPNYVMTDGPNNPETYTASHLLLYYDGAAWQSVDKTLLSDFDALWRGLSATVESNTAALAALPNFSIVDELPAEPVAGQLVYMTGTYSYPNPAYDADDNPDADETLSLDNVMLYYDGSAWQSLDVNWLNFIANDLLPGLTVMQTQIDENAAAISDLQTLDTAIFEVVETLPDAASANPNKIYLAPDATGSGDNLMQEWMVQDGAWELIGSASVDLDGYYNEDNLEPLTNTEIDTIFTNATV